MPAHNNYIAKVMEWVFSNDLCWREKDWAHQFFGQSKILIILASAAIFKRF